MKPSKTLLTTTFWVAVTLTAGSAAAEERLAPQVQAAMFKKVLPYERDLEGATIKVLVVSVDDTAEAEGIAAAFSSAGLAATRAKVSALPPSLGSGSVVYVMPGALSPALKEFCARLAVLSISGEPAYVRTADVSIGLAKKADGKPEILVNLTRLKEEGRALSSRLLALATVVP